MADPNTLRALRGPGRISVAYGNSPAPGLGKCIRYCGLVFLPVSLRVPCGLGCPKREAKADQRANKNKNNKIKNKSRQKNKTKNNEKTQIMKMTEKIDNEGPK